jgi:hypothetical protein
MKKELNQIPFPDIDDSFGNWLAGFVDGEGCFGIYNNDRGGRIYTFKVALRADDAEILREIKNKLGVGRFAIRVKNGPGSNPAAVWVVQSIAELHDVIVPLFTKYKLRTKKKRDFEMFAEAVMMRASAFNKHLSTEHRNDLLALAAQLRAVKKYSGDSHGLAQV